MNIENLFSNLKLNTWYMLLAYLGGILFIVSLLVDVKGITNLQLQILSGGIFCLGLGEWKNHKKTQWIKPPNAYTGPTALIEVTKWRPDLIGLLFDASGLLLLYIAIKSIYESI